MALSGSRSPESPPPSPPGGTTHGRLVVLEGPDGSGKSAQAVRLADHLRRQGHRVTLTREPGGTGLGEQVRGIVLDPGPTPRGRWADALLFGAARAQLVEEVISPALDRGDVVVCDRYSTSTLAYQGYGSGLDLERLGQLQGWITAGLLPDVIVLLDVPVEVGLARRGAGARQEMTRFEDDGRHDLAFHRRVRAGYLEMADREPGRWRVVDGRGAPDDVAREVARLVDAALRPGPSSSLDGGAGARAPEVPSA